MRDCAYSRTYIDVLWNSIQLGRPLKDSRTLLSVSHYTTMDLMPESTAIESLDHDFNGTNVPLGPPSTVEQQFVVPSIINKGTVIPTDPLGGFKPRGRVLKPVAGKPRPK